MPYFLVTVLVLIAKKETQIRYLKHVHSEVVFLKKKYTNYLLSVWNQVILHSFVFQKPKMPTYFLFRLGLSSMLPISSLKSCVEYYPQEEHSRSGSTQNSFCKQKCVLVKKLLLFEPMWSWEHMAVRSVLSTLQLLNIRSLIRLTSGTFEAQTVSDVYTDWIISFYTLHSSKICLYCNF